MVEPIVIRAAKADIGKYQQLLRDDWSKETVDDVLALLWKLSAHSVKTLKSPWQEVLEHPTEKKQGTILSQQTIRFIGEVGELYWDPPFPKVPHPSNWENSGKLTNQAEKAWQYLTLPVQTKLAGEIGLFHDTLSLLFLGSIHFVLPALKEHGHDVEKKLLLHAMNIHASLVWRHHPAHQYYLRSLLMDFLEDHQQRLECLFHSLQLTRLDDHSYLTKATTYWAELMDQGKRQQAMDFLLYLNRQAPMDWEAEISDMVKETASLTNHR
jgi:hypothetical protein